MIRDNFDADFSKEPQLSLSEMGDEEPTDDSVAPFDDKQAIRRILTKDVLERPSIAFTRRLIAVADELVDITVGRWTFEIQSCGRRQNGPTPTGREVLPACARRMGR